MPRLILAHNLHGIDIDLRASQIAALALWLRCQRAYQEMGLKKDRPKITRSNFVCAEPMPGEESMLKEFVGQLEPKVLGQVVEVVFDKMKLAGEAGSLLKIEEEIRDAVAEARKQWIRETAQATDRKGQPLLFTQAAWDQLNGKPEQQSLFDFSDLTEAQFFENAETRVIEALRSYAEKAQSGQKLKKRLFTDDAVRGFAFVDLCHKRYDVVLMNPPFGNSCKSTTNYFVEEYPNSFLDIYASFVERGCSLLAQAGMLGAITSRTGFFLSSLSKWRLALLSTSTFRAVLDLGSDVLDSALVSTAAYVLQRGTFSNSDAVVITLLNTPSTSPQSLLGNRLDISQLGSRVFITDFDTFRNVPSYPFCYWLRTHALSLFKSCQPFKADGRDVRVGVQTGDNFRFLRLFWEVDPRLLGQGKRWVPYAKGGDYSPYYRDIELVIDWDNDGRVIKEFAKHLYGSETRTIKSQDFYFRKGLTFTIYTVKGFKFVHCPPPRSLMWLDHLYLLRETMRMNCFTY